VQDFFKDKFPSCHSNNSVKSTEGKTTDTEEKKQIKCALCNEYSSSLITFSYFSFCHNPHTEMSIPRFVQNN